MNVRLVDIHACVAVVRVREYLRLMGNADGVDKGRRVAHLALLDDLIISLSSRSRLGLTLALIGAEAYHASH